VATERVPSLVEGRPGHRRASGDLASRSLIDQGLLDELTLMISPVVAGGGRKRLFAADAALTTD
jgi:hypothetical protein